MSSSKYWYSPIFETKDYGFYVEKKDNKYFLGYKDEKTKKETLIKINNNTFQVLKREWK